MNSSDSLPNWFLPKPKLYLAKYPNQPILLYKGFAEVIQGKNIVEGNATVLWVWFPYPHPKFEFINFSDTKVEMDDLILKLKEQEVSALAHVSQKTYTSDGKDIVSGYFCERVIQGKEQKLGSLIFYVSNFPFFNISNTWGIDEEGQEQELEGWLETVFEGQFVFQTEDWRVVLATLPDSWDIHQKLHSLGGYAITHICKLELRGRRNQLKHRLYKLHSS